MAETQRKCRLSVDGLSPENKTTTSGTPPRPLGGNASRTPEDLIRAASRSLGEVLDRDEAALASVRQLPDEAPTREDYVGALRGAQAGGGTAGFRAERRRRLLQVAALDLSGSADLVVVGRALADLADASLEVALELAEAPRGLAVIGMGKLGGRELNYASDIDVMFVTTGDLASATTAAERLLRLLTEFAPEGQAYRVDVDLRPEGRAGPLVRSLDGFLEYYRRWADPWEFQALIKARHSAGDPEAGRTLVEETRALVFPEEVTAERIANVRRIKERVEENAQRTALRSKSPEADDVKLGPGGIRDIEFSVQLLQLVHGGSDETVRSTNTLRALSALVEGGYVAEDDGAGLAVAYEWLRTVEHRLQLWQERQVHRLPKSEEDRARLARVMGYADSPVASATESFEANHRAVLADVRSRFEKLFYRPMIESLAGSGAHRLSSEALRERLQVLGFRDVERAARTLSGLVSGATRRSKLFRVLTPALLRHLALTPLPDEGLFSFLRLGEALEARADLLGALRDNPPGIGFLAHVLGSGRVLGDLLLHVPEELAQIADPSGPGQPKDRDRLVREARASLGWRDPDSRLDGLRRFKRREMLRIALIDLAGSGTDGTVGEALSGLAEACLEAGLEDVAIPFAVIGMGKLGGSELNYASDIDVMFVHGASAPEGEAVAERLLRAIGSVTPEGQAFVIDPALRPEGKSGPLARSIESFIEYYERWAQPWEFQALIKARPVAGDMELGARFVAETRRFSFPPVIPPGTLAEIRHLKARMERERIPRGTDPRRNLKLGPGGLSDVEFALQILQMSHGNEHEGLRAPGTMIALDAALGAGLLPPEDAQRLAGAYVFLSGLRDRLFFLTGRPQDALPGRAQDLEALGVAMGYRDQPRQELEENYLRLTRRARKAAERLIYG